MERSATEKGKDNNKCDRIQWLFRYGAYEIESGFLLPYHSSHQVANGPTAKSSGLFSPCLTFCSMTLLTTLFSSKGLLFSWSLASNLQTFWKTLPHGLLFFFLSLKCHGSLGLQQWPPSHQNIFPKITVILYLSFGYKLGNTSTDFSISRTHILYVCTVSFPI